MLLFLSMKYIDAHCHLQFDAYDEDRDEIIEQMKREDIHGIVVGVDLESSKKAIELAKKHEHLYATVGMHPCYTDKGKFIDEYKALAEDTNVVAIGECGLDYFRSEKTPIQTEVFRQQVQIAVDLDKALMIHSRPSEDTVDAYKDVIEILSEYKEKYGDTLRGNIHFFVGGDEERNTFNKLGFTVSVTGVITFTDDYNNMVVGAKHDMLLGETDSPYVTPVPHRGERNSALNVVHVYKKIATLWGVTEEQARESLNANTKRIFNL